MEDRTENDKQFHLRLSRSLFDRLERVAKQGHWSVSALMRLILEEGLKTREGGTDEALEAEV